MLEEVKAYLYHSWRVIVWREVRFLDRKLLRKGALMDGIPALLEFWNSKKTGDVKERRPWLESQRQSEKSVVVLREIDL